MEDKPICLLNEWQAKQDVHLKEKFYEKIIPLLESQDKTLILISYDDKYYDLADQVITLRNGQLDQTSVKA